MGQPRSVQATDTGYVKRYSNEPSVFAVPSRGLRSPWSYVTPFGAQAIRSPQTRLQSPVYGVPSSSLWTNALYQYGDAPRLSANQELPGEFLQEPVGAPEYEDTDEYEDSVDDGVVPEIPSYPELTETLPAGLDWGFVPAVEERPSPRYAPEDRREAYRDMLLPYLLYSAIDQENGLRQQRPQASDLFSVEQRGIHPQEKLPVDQKRAGKTEESPSSTPSQTSNDTKTTTTPATSASSHTGTQTPPKNSKVAEEKPNVAKMVAKDFSNEASRPDVKQVVAFDRGQKEFPMLRPPSVNRVATLKALSWPKELERDDTEEHN